MAFKTSSFRRSCERLAGARIDASGALAASSGGSSSPTERRGGHAWLVLFAVVLFWIAAGPAGAADDATLLRVRGESLASQGRCEEAVQVLSKAAQADPRDGRAHLLAGQCLIRLGRHGEAVKALERAKDREPSLPSTELYLGIALYHQGDLDRAERSLRAAATRTPDRAELHLYRGLVLLQRAEMRSAAAALERARQAGPDRVEPLASYYAGVAWANAEEQGRAEEALHRVQREAPGSVWADKAGVALEQLHRVGRATAWLEIMAGLEYDDNVVLRAGAVSLPERLSGQHDVRAVWQISAGSEFWNQGDWSAGTMLSYWGSEHEDLSEFDLQYPSWTLWLDRRLDEGWTARLKYDAAYAWFGASPFFFSQALTPTLFREWDDGALTRFYARVYRRNYFFDDEDVPGPSALALPGQCQPAATPASFCGPAGINERSVRNRDGLGVRVGVEHRFPIALLDTELRGGYAFHRFNSRGGEFTFDGHELLVGARSVLPLELILEASIRFTYRPYRDRSTYPDPSDIAFNQIYPLQSADRRDEIWTYEVGLERAITDHVSAAVRYSYHNNDSNVAVFDYDREILGAYLTVRFQK